MPLPKCACIFYIKYNIYVCISRKHNSLPEAGRQPIIKQGIFDKKGLGTKFLIKFLYLAVEIKSDRGADKRCKRE